MGINRDRCGWAGRSCAGLEAFRYEAAVAVRIVSKAKLGSAGQTRGDCRVVQRDFVGRGVNGDNPNLDAGRVQQRGFCTSWVGENVVIGLDTGDVIDRDGRDCSARRDASSVRK